MADLKTAITRARESAAAILRVQLDRPEKNKKGKVRPARFKLSWGSAFCIVADRYLITAHHVLNGGQPRNANDRFYAFTVPGNGNNAHHYPVISFPLERADIDLAVLEVGPCATAGVRMPGLPLAFDQKPDGERVVTIGFPAPEVVSVNISADLNYHGGQFFLKSHANEGIVSAQYLIGVDRLYELNVGWHQGESGGAIVSIDDPLGAFSVMQHYRNIQGPSGLLAGPRRGIALASIQQDLLNLGATST